MLQLRNHRVTSVHLPPCRRVAGIATALVATVFMLSAAAAHAQSIPDEGGRVFGLVGGSFGDGHSAFLISGGAGLRLDRHLGLDVELLHVSTLDLAPDDAFVIQPLPAARFADLRREASVTAFLTKIVVDFPVGDRLVPFFSGGGGVARIHEDVFFGFASRAELDDARGLLDGLPAGFPLDRLTFAPDILFFPPSFELAETGLGLTFGGGLDVRLWRGLTVGAEARWLRVLADHRTVDFAHVGSRVAYRF